VVIAILDPQQLSCHTYKPAQRSVNREDADARYLRLTAAVASTGDFASADRLRASSLDGGPAVAGGRLALVPPRARTVGAGVLTAARGKENLS
jgi:hypothetical protein